jgi:hypothetical protein
MKRFATLAVVCLVAFVLNLMMQKASARPAYPKRLAEVTKNAKAADAIKEQKCNACHDPKDKKKRNDFGKAVNKNLTKDDFMSLKDDMEKLNKKVDDAIKAALKEKSSDGKKTYGEMIEAGEVPVKTPE